MKQISARIPRSMKNDYDDKCNREGRLSTITLSLIIEAFLNEEFSEMWEEEKKE
jgi:predicted DNA-binding protein